MRKKLVLCCRSRAPHHSASRSAHRPQSRRGCGPVSAQSQRGPRRRCEQLAAILRERPSLRAQACAWVSAVVCVRHRACLCMRAREPTACMIWRMQTRAYVDVGAGVGASVGEGVGVDVGAGVGVSVGAGVGLHAPNSLFYVAAHVRPPFRQSQRRSASVPARMWTSIGAAPARCLAQM